MTHTLSSLLAIPMDATLELFSKVPQVVYTGGSWTPIFDDPHLLEEVQLSARHEAQLSARKVRCQFVCHKLLTLLFPFSASIARRLLLGLSEWLRRRHHARPPPLLPMLR